MTKFVQNLLIAGAIINTLVFVLTTILVIISNEFANMVAQDTFLFPLILMPLITASFLLFIAINGKLENSEE